MIKIQKNLYCLIYNNRLMDLNLIYILLLFIVLKMIYIRLGRNVVVYYFIYIYFYI